MDAETDLYYYGARYYDAKIGRFVSVDTWSGDLSDPQSFNKYSYVRNNPLKYVDPSGEFFFLAAPLAVWAGEAIIQVAALAAVSTAFVSIMAENAVTDYNTATNWNSAGKLDKSLLVADVALTVVGASSPLVKSVVSKVDKAVEEIAPMRAGFAERLGEQLEKGAKWKQEKIHGNSLESPAKNTGYTLRNKETGEIMKYGETIHPESRYSQKYLQENNVRFQEEISGSKPEVHQWQHDQIMEYKSQNNGQRPPLNKSDW